MKKNFTARFDLIGAKTITELNMCNIPNNNDENTEALTKLQICKNFFYIYIIKHYITHRLNKQKKKQNE